MHRADQ
jgi:hypothetical protein